MCGMVLVNRHKKVCLFLRQIVFFCVFALAYIFVSPTYGASTQTHTTKCEAQQRVVIF